MLSQVCFANAPISYGAFELTVGIDPNVPDGLQVLDEVARAGYEGIDLGPVGFLGEGEQLATRLNERGLGLAGAYLEFPFTDSQRSRECLPELDAMLDVFDAVSSLEGRPLPRPTIADAGSAIRRNSPARASNDPSLSLSEAEWQDFAATLCVVVDRCRERGYEPTFHPETGSYIEAPHEVDRLLELSNVGFCLDTGHLQIGGGDPAAVVTRWGSRINHVHLKDVNMAVIDSIVAAGDSTPAIWSLGAFPALGDGDVNLMAVSLALMAIDYAGWVVVEQDIMPRTREGFSQAVDDQHRNRRFVESLVWSGATGVKE